MPLEINITTLNSAEITKILNLYPFGSLEIKSDHIFWISSSMEPQNTRDFPTYPPQGGRPYPQQPQKPGQQNAGQQAARAFKKMSDTLGSLVC